MQMHFIMSSFKNNILSIQKFNYSEYHTYETKPILYGEYELRNDKYRQIQLLDSVVWRLSLDIAPG